MSAEALGFSGIVALLILLVLRVPVAFRHVSGRIFGHLGIERLEWSDGAFVVGNLYARLQQ